MKRVIDRKMYDTDRAEQIAQYAPNTHRGDDYHCLETLFKAPTGEYFLHCEGYAVTEYVHSYAGEGRIAGEELIRLDAEAALDWCEERAIDGQVVVKEFDEFIET